MANDPSEHEHEDDDHNGDCAERYDHVLPPVTGRSFLIRRALNGLQHLLQAGIALRAQLKRLFVGL